VAQGLGPEFKPSTAKKKKGYVNGIMQRVTVEAGFAQHNSWRFI
jgi:hypothetical protein